MTSWSLQQYHFYTWYRGKIELVISQNNATHSVLQGISHTLKYWSPPFLSTPSPPKKILNLSHPPPFPPPPSMSNPLKILENVTLSLSPLKGTLVQKKKVSFFEKTKDFISNTSKYRNMNIQLQNLKNQRRVRRLLSILFLLGRLNRHF